MKILKRNCTIEERTEKAEHNLNEYLPNCQASFNSDGNITLRSYDRSNKNKDEIIILSTVETDALFRLFSQIGVKNRAYTLPF